jgi:hypothetical protein
MKKLMAMALAVAMTAGVALAEQRSDQRYGL